MAKKEKSLKMLFLHEKPVKIIMALRDNAKSYASTLAKAADCTYSHTVKILDSLRGVDVVEFKKRGRVKYVKLTEVGEGIAKDFESLGKKFSRIKERKK